MDEPFLALVRSAMASVKKPTAFDVVYKDECQFCFDTPFSEGGLYVNLSSLMGVGHEFLDLDRTRTGNKLYLHQKFTKTKVDTKGDTDEHETPAAAVPTQMAIGTAGGFDVDESGKFEIAETYALVVFDDSDQGSNRGRSVSYDANVANDDLPFIVTDAIHAIVKHAGFHAQVETAAWREEIGESKYARGLKQTPATELTKVSPDSSKWVCVESNATENLWLNLGDGHIGSGRQHWDGSGGNGGALRHYKAEKAKGHLFPLVVKLGTITPTGADVYSYATDEDDMVTDPLLSEHLAHWGINVMRMRKTEKSMAELQIDLNKGFEFDKITEAGKELVSVTGPDKIGLENMGNSCYLNSVLQVMKLVPLLRENYGEQVSGDIFKSLPSSSDPTTDFSTQMSKVITALTTDRYVAAPNDCDDAPQTSVSPRMFKRLVGKNHTEFSTGRQQDAVEYFQHLLEVMARAEHSAGDRFAGSKKSLSEFEFEVEERVRCSVSGQVRYVTRRENVLPLEVPIEAVDNAMEVDHQKELKRQRVDGDGAKEDEKDEKEEKTVPTVPFEACLGMFAADEQVDDWHSTATGKKGTATKRTRFKTLPNVLAVQVRRYYVADDWTPKKLNALVPMPDVFDLEGLRGSGLVSGETLLPEDDGSSVGGGDSGDAVPPYVPGLTGGTLAPPTLTVPDDAIVATLVSMGFSENGSKRAAVATQNVSADTAMEWVFAHMEDPDFNDPVGVDDLMSHAGTAAAGSTAAADGVITGGNTTAAASATTPESVTMLSSMGFSESQASVALRRSAGDVERAADWLFSHADDLEKAVGKALGELDGGGGDGGGTCVSSVGDSSAATPCVDGKGVFSLFGVVSHMGGNTGCGHYVAHVLVDNEWYIFNDAKVAKSKEPPKDVGYLYFYKRV